MKIRYDFHIHSALSPCGDDAMTPCNIAAAASLNGLDAIALTDHNAIANVQAVAAVCEAFGVLLLPGIEIQTAEDIHVLALFDRFEKLERFFASLPFRFVRNRPEIYGRQLIMDENDAVVGEEERLLINACEEGIYTVCAGILKAGGKAVLAHIDRQENGILSILGEIPPDLPFSAVEFSPTAPRELREKYAEFRQLTDSDSHRIDTLLEGSSELEAADKTLEAVFEAI